MTRKILHSIMTANLFCGLAFSCHPAVAAETKANPVLLRPDVESTDPEVVAWSASFVKEAIETFQFTDSAEFLEKQLVDRLNSGRAVPKAAIFWTLQAWVTYDQRQNRKKPVAVAPNAVRFAQSLLKNEHLDFYAALDLSHWLSIAFDEVKQTNQSQRVFAEARAKNLVSDTTSYDNWMLGGLNRWATIYASTLYLDLAAESSMTRNKILDYPAGAFVGKENQFNRDIYIR